jgi:ABC-type molybdenum transport system ATPase subunit/photorepair protein PhrA
MEEDSGGVVDVAAFVLRLSCLMLSKPAVRRIIVLDEPFKFVSIEYRDNVRMMLEKLSSDFDIQFIMVTHIEELVTGKEVQL